MGATQLKLAQQYAAQLQDQAMAQMQQIQQIQMPTFYEEIGSTRLTPVTTSYTSRVLQRRTGRQRPIRPSETEVDYTVYYQGELLEDKWFNLPEGTRVSVASINRRYVKTKQSWEEMTTDREDY